MVRGKALICLFPAPTPETRAHQTHCRQPHATHPAALRMKHTFIGNHFMIKYDKLVTFPVKVCA